MLGSDRIIALDIGASKVVVAEFSVARGAPQLLNYSVMPLGVETDTETDTSAYVVAAIRDAMRVCHMKPAPLLMTVSGQAVFPRYVKLPPVAKDKLYQIISYEAEQNVPFPIDEVVWDYQLIAGDETTEQNVMLVAVKIENVTHLTDCVLAAGLEPEIVDVAPMALYNTVRFNYPDLDGCTMVLDVGARSSNLIFVEESKIFSRSIPVAGNAITNELMKEFDLSFSDAEALKKQHAFVAFGGVYAGPDNEVAERVSKIVRSVVTRLHAEVNRSVNFYRSQQGGSPPTLILLSGGTSVIPHFDTFFREKLKVPVDYLNPFANIAVGEQIDTEQIGRDLHLLGEVAGLALRRSLTCPVEINLMPPGLLAKKIFRKRQPFFAMSAVGLVLIMLCWWVYFQHMTTKVVGTRARDVEESTEELKAQWSRIATVLQEKKTAQTRADQLRQVVGWRTQWPEMIQAIHGCMLEGMWLRRLHPVTVGGKIVYIEIEGRGFLDKMKDSAEETALEQFVGRLRASPYFKDDEKQTKIMVEPLLRPGDYARDFTIRVALERPIGVG